MSPLWGHKSRCWFCRSTRRNVLCCSRLRWGKTRSQRSKEAGNQSWLKNTDHRHSGRQGQPHIYPTTLRWNESGDMSSRWEGKVKSTREGGGCISLLLLLRLVQIIRLMPSTIPPGKTAVLSPYLSPARAPSPCSTSPPQACCRYPCLLRATFCFRAWIRTENQVK